MEQTSDFKLQTSDFSQTELMRYSRHLLMPEVGVEGQRKLKAGSVLLVGTGGLGSPLALYLAAAGVGHLGLLDSDVVDESNLQRQILYGSAMLGVAKAQSARARLHDLNPYVELTPIEDRLTAANALELLRPYDIIVDGSDNFPTRYLVNDACTLLGKPNVHGSIFRFEGQATVFAPDAGGPCYRCLYPEPPPPGLVPSCAEAGVLGVLPGVIGTIQATEAIKLLTGLGEPLIGRLLLYDALAMQFRELKLRKNPACPLCGSHPTITSLIDYEQFCVVGPQAAKQPTITARELAVWLDRPDRPFLLDVRTRAEAEAFTLPCTDTLIPIDQLAGRIGELDSTRAMVVYCHSGIRSAQAVEMLRAAGFRHVQNLSSGIVGWMDEAARCRQ